MNLKETEGQAFITLAEAARMSKRANLNEGRGISLSTLRRWAIRGYARGGSPITRHPNLPNQIDREQWAKFVGGSPAAEYETARMEREIERRNRFMGGDA